MCARERERASTWKVYQWYQLLHIYRYIYIYIICILTNLHPTSPHPTPTHTHTQRDYTVQQLGPLIRFQWVEAGLNGKVTVSAFAVVFNLCLNSRRKNCRDTFLHTLLFSAGIPMQQCGLFAKCNRWLTFPHHRSLGRHVLFLSTVCVGFGGHSYNTFIVYTLPWLIFCVLWKQSLLSSGPSSALCSPVKD